MRFDWLSVRFGLEYLAFRTAGLIFKGLGLERASAVSGAVWRAVAPWSKRHQRALGHLGFAFPSMSAAEKERICRSMWHNLGCTFAEAFFLPEIAAGDRVTLEGIEAFGRWLALEGGRVACAPHLGNWELTILPAARHGVRPWSIYQKIKNPLVDRDVAAMRSFLYTGGLVAKHAGVPRQFVRIIRDGGTVCLLADLREYGGMTVPFLGRPAPSTNFPALLALTAGTPILVSGLRRLPGVRFIQVFELVELSHTGDRKLDLIRTTEAIHAAFERLIRQWPDQWMWAHRRWG